MLSCYIEESSHNNKNEDAMTTVITTRRRFLAAAMACSGVAASPAVLRQSLVWAQAGGQPGDAMIRMARLLMPHDAIADVVYAEVLDTALQVLAGNLGEQFAQAEQALDAGAGGDFLSADAGSQLEALTALQGSDNFAAILGAMKLLFYGHPGTWRALDYEGPSWQQGGYIDRGAGEIDWLPEAD
jgi:hypothetical protein